MARFALRIGAFIAPLHFQCPRADAQIGGYQQRLVTIELGCSPVPERLVDMAFLVLPCRLGQELVRRVYTEVALGCVNRGGLFLDRASRVTAGGCLLEGLER